MLGENFKSPQDFIENAITPETFRKIQEENIGKEIQRLSQTSDEMLISKQL